MTDLHSHVLPGMDDGAKSVEISLRMLRAEWKQGVSTVVATPHFYRDVESPRSFLHRRKEAVQRLMEGMKPLPMESLKRFPSVRLGAEVAWVPNLALWPELRQLCYEGTSYILIEPPFQPWSESMFRQLYDLIDGEGLTPVIAHLDRYLDRQDSGKIREICAMGLPIQISADMFSGVFNRLKGMRLIKSGKAQLLISDCHNMTTRPPNLGPAMEYLRGKLGERAEALFDATDEIIRPRRETRLFEAVSK